MNNVNEALYRKIVTKFSIHEPLDNFNKFEMKFLDFQFNVNKLFKGEYSHKHITNVIENLQDWIILLDYIEHNIGLYYINDIDRISTDIIQNGFINSKQVNQISQQNHPDKDVYYQVSMPHRINQRKKIIKVDFNLLDKYVIFGNKYNNNNLISLIDSLDQLCYAHRQLEIKHRNTRKDKLFAIVTMENDIYHTCEYAATWIINTEWKFKFFEIQNAIKNFCVNEKLPYHFPFHISKAFLKEAMYDSNRELERLYQRTLITKQGLKNANQVNAIKAVLKLIQKKINLLKINISIQLIEAENAGK